MSNSSGDFIVTEVATYGSAYSAFPPQGYLLIGPTPTREYRRISCWCMDISRNRTIPRVSPSLCHRMRPQCRSWPYLKGVNTFTPVEGGTGGPGQASSTAATSLVAPSINVTQSNDTLLTFYVAKGTVNFSSPTPITTSSPCDYTQGACIEAPTTHNGSSFSATFADNSLAAAQGSQSTGNQNITISASAADWLAMQVALEPASAASP